MSKGNHLKGLNKQLKERNPIIQTLLNDFNNDRDDDDMVIENAVYGKDNDDMTAIFGSYAIESNKYDEVEADFEDLIDDEDDIDDDEPLDEGIDPDLGEEDDDADEYDDEDEDDIDLEDVMEAVGIFDSVDDHFNPHSEIPDICIDFLDDEL